MTKMTNNNVEVVSELANTAMNVIMERHYVNAEYILRGIYSYSCFTFNDSFIRAMANDMLNFELPRDKTKAIQYLDKFISYCEALSLV